MVCFQSPCSIVSDAVHASYWPGSIFFFLPDQGFSPNFNRGDDTRWGGGTLKNPLKPK